MGKGEWTKAALAERFSDREYEDTMLACARDYALGHKMGARATLSTGLFPGVGRNKLHETIKGTSALAKREQGKRLDTDILTKDAAKDIRESLLQRAPFSFEVQQSQKQLRISFLEIAPEELADTKKPADTKKLADTKKVADTKKLAPWV